MKQTEYKKIDFGDYVSIEMKRYGVPNEFYTHKVVGRLRSNSYVDVPVQSPSEEVIHSQIEDVVACICQGVSERTVLNFRVKDVVVGEVVGWCAICNKANGKLSEDGICKDCL